MHFWIDKRGPAGQRRVPSTVWCNHSAPKPTRLAMTAPVHRYPALPTAADATSHHLPDPIRPPPLTAAAGPPASSSASEPPLAASPHLPSPASDEVDCMPCCCVLSSTVIGVFTLTAVQMYLEHIFHHSSSSVDPTGIIFLFAFLFVCLLFFARLVLLRKRRSAAETTTTVYSDVVQSRNSVSDGEPPPYEEAIRLPAPPMASPPPDYDKGEAARRAHAIQTATTPGGRLGGRHMPGGQRPPDPG